MTQQSLEHHFSPVTGPPVTSPTVALDPQRCFHGTLRSDRQGAPVLICPVHSPTARSAMVVSWHRRFSMDKPSIFGVKKRSTPQAMVIYLLRKQPNIYGVKKGGSKAVEATGTNGGVAQPAPGAHSTSTGSQKTRVGMDNL